MTKTRKRTRKSSKKAPTKVDRKTPRITVTVIPPACLRCGSTERTGKVRVTRRELRGVLPNGQEYSHVENWRAVCKACGQRISYNEYVNRVEGDA